MPDYSLKRSNPPQEQPQAPSPIAQLSQASQQAKLETENALLREALATSAQNCETLIQQLVESQKEFRFQTAQTLGAIQNAVSRTGEISYHSLNEMKTQIEENDQHHLNQLSKLQNQNQLFSQSLNAALMTVVDKLSVQIKGDTDIALKSHMAAIDTAFKKYQRSMDSVSSNIDGTVDRLTKYDKTLKANLDKSVKSYRASINGLFQLNDTREKVFWLGMFGGIATSILLLLYAIVQFIF